MFLKTLTLEINLIQVHIFGWLWWNSENGDTDLQCNTLSFGVMVDNMIVDVQMIFGDVLKVFVLVIWYKVWISMFAINQMGCKSLNHQYFD